MSVETFLQSLIQAKSTKIKREDSITEVLRKRIKSLLNN